MDESAVKQIVDANIERLINILGLNDWRIEVDYGPCAKPEWGAQCHRQNGYNIAEITMNPARHKDEAMVIENLMHELLHVLLSPFDVYREIVTVSAEVDAATDEQERRLWNFTVEQAVGRLERGLIHALTPATKEPHDSEGDN